MKIILEGGKLFKGQYRYILAKFVWFFFCSLEIRWRFLTCNEMTCLEQYLATASESRLFL